MSADRDGEFEQSMKEFVKLLKKLMKNLPSQGSFSPQNFPMKELEGKGVNMNVYFFSFLPLSAEDFEELEDLYEQYLHREDDPREEFSTSLNKTDLEFLRRHGIRF